MVEGRAHRRANPRHARRAARHQAAAAAERRRTGYATPSSRRSIRCSIRACGPASISTCAKARSTSRWAICGRIETQLKTESNRLDSWKQSFDKRLADLQTAATEAALLEVQRTLEAIQPKQAKEQIMKMLAEPKTAADDPMEDVVRILKAMPLDKRKKILAEFKTPEEIEKLSEILRVIRLGGSDTDLLRDTRGQLQQQNANSQRKTAHAFPPPPAA